MLGLIFAANDQLLARGRPGLPFHLFYNDAVNQEVNLKEDYRRWKAGGSDELSLTLTLTLALTLTWNGAASAEARSRPRCCSPTPPL